MKEIVNGAMCKMPDAPCNTLEEKVQRLLDIEEIKTIPFHYARNCDRLDPEAITSIFTEDGIYWSGVCGPVKGRKAIGEYFGSAYVHEKSATHLMGNQQVWFETNDKATVFTYFHSWSTFKDPQAKDRYTYGRYEIKAVRDTDGEWRAHDMHIVIAGMSGTDVVGEHFGRPWPCDPSYGCPKENPNQK